MDGTSKTQAPKGSTRFSNILKQKAPVSIELDEQVIYEEISNASSEAITPIVEISERNEIDIIISRKSRKKIAKRGNPDYTQSLFWLLHKTSKRLDRELLNLSDAGENLDRSELVEELLSVFYKLSEKIGAEEAFKRLKQLKE